MLVGTVFSLLTAVNITRAFVDVVVDNDVVDVAGLVRGIRSASMFFRKLNWDIIGQRNIWFALSAAVIIAGIIALFVHHGLPLGLSFTGGSTHRRQVQPIGHRITGAQALSAVSTCVSA